MRVDYRAAFPDRVTAVRDLEQAVRSSTLEPDLLEPVRAARLPRRAGRLRPL